jgi:hypothetical protein
MAWLFGTATVALASAIAWFLWNGEPEVSIRDREAWLPILEDGGEAEAVAVEGSADRRSVVVDEPASVPRSADSDFISYGQLPPHIESIDRENLQGTVRSYERGVQEILDRQRTEPFDLELLTKSYHRQMLLERMRACVTLLDQHRYVTIPMNGRRPPEHEGDLVQSGA